MQWNKISVDLNEETNSEIIIAWMHFADVESIVENDNSIDAYCLSSKVDQTLKILKDHVPEIQYRQEIVPDKNWNELWESNFKSLDVGDVHIRADFHPPTDKREIVIEPKMAFGTGHHETTFMMIERMNTLDLSGKRVLDYGCGTGILSVMASMQNADYIEAVDIQDEAIENSLEHFELNNVKCGYLLAVGDLDVLQCKRFDLILANINRHVLTQNHEELYSLLEEDGSLYVSGILIEDRNLITELYCSIGFKLVDSNERGEWCLFVFEK